MFNKYLKILKNYKKLVFFIEIINELIEYKFR
jgi:hypothetical protein